MAEPLKKQFGPEVVRRISDMISAVYSEFPAGQFFAEVIDGYEELELMQRGRKIARVLKACLPVDYKDAAKIIIDSLGPKLDDADSSGMESFVYMPYVFFVDEFGLDNFETSMLAQYELTQRFTAEFSIRTYIIAYPEKTLERLKEWAQDKSEHVRRLVSEGTRSRLPWAPRLRRFQEDPAPVVELLELLKDDPELYVRRSVANNLNDIGKDNPEVLYEVARCWMQDATDERKWLVRHALRSAVKKSKSEAFEILGFKKNPQVKVENVEIYPDQPRIGDKLKIRFGLTNRNVSLQRLLVDLKVHYVKSNGKSRPRVFKLKEIELGPQQTVQFKKTIHLKQMTTRKHYPGIHKLEILLNGSSRKLGQFDLRNS